MADHTIFIEANTDRYDNQVISLSVLCSCTALLLEVTDTHPQMSMDIINEVRWAHWDEIPHTESDCEVCG